jgi:phospholipase C
VEWAPLLSFDRFLDDPKLSSHIVDLKQYYVDLQNDTLPAVSYIVLLGASEHPGTNIQLGEKAVRSMIQALMQSSAWSSSAFLLSYDDWGGWYDHVAPPQVDANGYGFRVPALLVSPYARRGAIDSTQLDHASNLKFIEDNWGIPPLAERDTHANDFLSAFDFSKPPREPAFVSFTYNPPAPSIEPSHTVIYTAYGAALMLAVLVLAGALISKPRQRIEALVPPAEGSSS